MIKYNLKCECGKIFESWFSSSLEFDSLSKKNFIKCIQCGSSSVNKSVMAPNLYSKSNKISKKTQTEKKVKKKLLDFRKYIEKNCKNVGDDFSREARNIHYENKKSTGIYGKASPEDTAELIEEGIDVVTVPWVDNSEN
jgi:hypothetical protein